VDISPLIDAGAIVVFHTASALLSLVLGIYILARPKGTQVHFWMGRTWITAMLCVVISSFMIFEIRLLGPFSPIHLLSLFTLWALWAGWRAAKQHDHRRHAIIMISLWIGALGLNVWFTLLPGRTLHAVIFGS